jgi:peptidoglycan hydrolase-like protein with peptidoglycan-binding domain
MLEQIQALIAQVEDLQNQLNELRGEVRDVLKEGLEQGMSDEDIKKIQEILATDPSVYPEGLTTVYFGPLTKNDLMSFQNKFGLEETGTINEETREYLEELLQERFGE